jgi:hypothetical protein
MKTVTIQTTVSVDIADAVDARAKEELLSRAAWLRRLAAAAAAPAKPAKPTEPRREPRVTRLP